MDESIALVELSHTRTFKSVDDLICTQVATDAPITALKRSGSAFAVADGAVVRFVSSSRWRLSPAVCRGPPATVSDVAFDALNPGVLHVAYETGELLAFNTRARQGDGGAPACRLTTKLPSSPHVAPPKLATTKGFLVSEEPRRKRKLLELGRFG